MSTLPPTPSATPGPLPGPPGEPPPGPPPELREPLPEPPGGPEPPQPSEPPPEPPPEPPDNDVPPDSWPPPGATRAGAPPPRWSPVGPSRAPRTLGERLHYHLSLTRHNVTFRARLVLAATAAVVVAVVLASGAAYVASERSLVDSIDVTIGQQAQSLISGPGVPAIPNECVSSGQCFQVVAGNGAVNPGDPQVLPVPPSVRAVALSQGNAPSAYFTTVTNGSRLREVTIALPPQFLYRSQSGVYRLPAGGALQLTAPLAGVDQELRHLFFVLLVVAGGGVALAVILGYGVGRAVLGPLNQLTDNVEELAEHTDVSHRLDPGGRDELGRLRRAFNRLLSALDLSREAQRQLVLDASHELRTPLTSLRTNLEVARRLDELDPGERDVLIGDVLTQLDELTTLVGDLAELARGDQPGRAAQAFRLDRLVEDAVSVATTHGRRRNITFALEASPCWVSGTRSRIERAVGNLLDNTLKWSPEGATVEVTCADGEVAVRDHGPGIAEADLPYIFARFYRAADARGKPGSGLGLAIVAQVASEEGGTVTAENAEGGGALFRLRFPTTTAGTPSGGSGRHPAGSGGR